MGCTACTELCGNQNDSFKPNSQFLKIAQSKAMFLRKIFSKPQQKKFLDEYISSKQMEIILKLFSMQQTLRPQNFLLPEAGQLCYLSPIRRTLWKLYSFDILSYQYSKNPTIPSFTQDFTLIKISAKTQQRFYEINLDINRTFPLVKHLDRNNLSIVLKNLTLYFDGVGYTQGMNFVVGFLLLCGFTPKQAYWMFINLSLNQNFLLIRNFSEGFKNALFMINVFEEFMDNHQYLKSVKAKVDQMGLTSFFYSFSWFLCYFLYSLEPKCCVLIWDYLLTYDSSKNSRNSILNNDQSIQQIKQLSQFQSEIRRKRKNFPEYFQIIQSHRGSILNLLYLAFKIMQQLSEHIHQSQSPEQLMKILRNQSLIEKITPQIILSMIQQIKSQKNFQNFTKELNWKSFVSKMASEDKELFQIQTSEQGHKKFIEECIGLRRNSSQKTKEIHVESNDKTE